MTMGNYATATDVREQKISGVVVDLAVYTDAEIEENIGIAESIIEGYLNTIFYSVSAIEYFNGTGNQNLYVYQRLNIPLISASACTEVNTNDDVLFEFVEGTDFTIQGWYLAKVWHSGSARNIIGSAGPTWRKGHRNIKIDGEWGRAAVPVEIKRATVLLALEISLPGSSKLKSNAWFKRRWDDFEEQTRGSSDKMPDPGDSTGFDFIDKLIDKHRFKPDMFLTPEVHIPIFL